MAAIELNQGTQNAAVKMTVEMSYAYWESSDIKTNSVGTSVAPRLPASTFESIDHSAITDELRAQGALE